MPYRPSVTKTNIVPNILPPHRRTDNQYRIYFVVFAAAEQIGRDQYEHHTKSAPKPSDRLLTY